MKHKDANLIKESRIPVWITDASVVTALGNTLQETWLGLMAGKTAIKPVNRFSVSNYNSRIAAYIEDLEPFGYKSMIYSLLDRLFDGMGPVPSDSLLIIATTKSGIDNLELFCRGVPVDHNDILLTAPADKVAQRFTLKNNGVNISAACASSTIAVALGATFISSGLTEAVLVCCMDLVTEFVLSGFSCLKALSPTPCMPFDRHRNGLSIGEGAACLLLMSPKRAQSENRRHMATIVGWGIANDATHITAPAKDAGGLIQAIQNALKKGGLKAHKISAINAHGTGTVYNDLMELTAFRQVFGELKIPIHSVKGAIGHTLGAAGGIEVAIGIKPLIEKIVPPTAGFSDPEEGARDLVSSKYVDLIGDYLLTTNSGFGGINAALILERGSAVLCQ